MNAFDAYSRRASTIANQPAALLGPIKLRGDARLRCGEITSKLATFETSAEIEEYLASIADELVQFRAELDFLWFGDGDFRGLEKEIEWARARVDDGLDFPRWEIRQEEKEEGQ